MENADDDVSIDGLAATMAAVLELHRGYPQNRALLAGKQPVPVEKRKPEEYPTLGHFQPMLDYSGEVAKSCIHCHQIRDAQRVELRVAENPIPDQLLFPYPAPSALGVLIDPDSRATISQVDKGSLADRAKFEAGDQIESINGQFIASPADVQWVLHHASDGEQLLFSVLRDDQTVEIAVKLPAGWRQTSDISWRATSWDLRRMATGGMVLVGLSEKEKKRLDLDSNSMALRVTHVGLFGQHAIAHHAGIKKGDILVSFDQRTDLLTESAVIRHAINAKRPGDVINVSVNRNGQAQDFQIRQQ